MLKKAQKLTNCKWLGFILVLSVGILLGYHYFDVPFFTEDVLGFSAERLTASSNAFLGAAIALFAKSLSTPQPLDVSGSYQRN